MSQHYEVDEPLQQSSTQSKPFSRLWMVVFAFFGFALLGLLLVWLQSLNPLFGVPMGDPASLITIVVLGLLGVFGALMNQKPVALSMAPGELHDEVRRLAEAGEKIRAIKLYRDLTGAGLADAKAIVEGYLKESRSRN